MLILYDIRNFSSMLINPKNYFAEDNINALMAANSGALDMHGSDSDPQEQEVQSAADALNNGKGIRFKVQQLGAEEQDMLDDLKDIAHQ